MVKGPRVSVCPRAPGHSVTPLPPPPSVPFQSCTKLSPRLSYVTFHSFHMEFHTTQSVISSFTCLSFCCTGNLLKLFIGLSAMTSTIWESDWSTRWNKEAVHILKEGRQSMNRDEGRYMPSYMYDWLLAMSHLYRGKNRKNWTSFFWWRSLLETEASM